MEQSTRLEPVDDELHVVLDYLLTQIAAVTSQVPERYPGWREFIGSIGGTIAGVLELAAEVG